MKLEKKGRFPNLIKCEKVLVAQSLVDHSLRSYGLYVAHKAPLPIEFFRQQYWSGLPFPTPRDLPNPGIEPESPALQVDSSPLSP